MSHLEWIRERYGVPAWRGQKIRFRPLPALSYYGQIISGKDGKLWARMSHAIDEDGYHALNGFRMGPFHPTWKMYYWVDDEWKGF